MEDIKFLVDKFKELIRNITQKYNIFDMRLLFLDMASENTIIEFIKSNSIENEIMNILESHQNLIEKMEKQELYDIYKNICDKVGNNSYISLKKFL